MKLFPNFLKKANWLRLESFYEGKALTFMYMICLCLPYLTIPTKNCYAGWPFDTMSPYDFKYGALGREMQGYSNAFDANRINQGAPAVAISLGNHNPDIIRRELNNANAMVEKWNINSPYNTIATGMFNDNPMATLINNLEATCNSGGCNNWNFGGGGNQYLGSTTYPSSWNSSFSGLGYDSYNAGLGISLQNPIFGVALGYNPYSSYNVGTQYLMSMNNMFSPPSSLNSGFGSYVSGSLTRDGLQSANGNMLGIQAENTLAFRYQAIGKQQLNFYYTNPDLYNLRIEANNTYMFYLYTDPWYLYHSYQQIFNSNTVSTTRPSYPSLSNLSWEIATWTSPPNDIQTLKDRFNKRLLLTYYNARLASETQDYFSLNPDQADYMLYTKSNIDQIIQKNWGTAELTTWATDWDSRFQSKHENSEAFAMVQEEMAEILEDFPAFEEYLRLNSDVISLIPDFEDYASVKQTQDKLKDVLSDSETSQKISNYYNLYREQVSALLETTDVKAEMERFYEQINGLLNADPTYQLLKFTDYARIISLEDYRKKVHDLVYNCQLIYGTWCDPYSNADIINLIYSQDTYDLIYYSAQFYEMYNYFWYTFYNSAVYLDIEADAAEKIQTALNPVLPQLTSIQTEYINNVNSIPKIKAFQEAMVNMMRDLRSKSPELDQNLTRMAQLAEDLYNNPTPPIVASTSPANGATNVAVGSNITATFSEEMNRNTITKSTFTLNNGVTGTISYKSSTKTATFNPSTDLSYSTTYTAKITTGVKDYAGNAMTSNYTWTFTTAPPPDTTPPTVTSTNPINGATNVAVSSNITATFSEAMNAATITTSTFKLNNGVTGTVSYNSATRTATFDPSTNLNYSTTYTATITTGVKDSTGNPMTSNYTWSFTTAPLPDTTPPMVTSTSPTNGATNVAIGSNITAIFSEAMKASTITTATFTLNNGVTGTVSYNSATRTATFDPSANLNYSTTYTATITTGAKDAAGNPITANYQWSFTTGTSGTDVFTAYNDLAWSAGQVNNKITLYTTGQGGLLKDYLTGANTPVTLTIAGGYVVSGTLTQGSNANVGTDAYNIFNGIVNSVGLISYSATNLTFTFTGLDPDLNYEFVLFGNRNDAPYNNRSTTTTISDVTSFTNASTPGTAFSGATDPAVTIVNGDNTANGHVARFTNIIPGADGDILITVSSPTGKFYANALMLRATQSSDTTTPEVSATNPVNNATGVPVNSVIKATFNEAMDAGSITPSTFLVSDGITNIGGTVSYSGATATFTPSGPLAHSTKYTATITTGVMDVAGNPMTANYKWSFTTGTSGTDVFTAYNDLSWSAGQVNDKITLYTTGQGGLLKDYLTGANTPVTLTIAGGYVVSGTLAQGSNANTGTDAYNIFNGIVNSVGLISYSATNLTFTFTGLDPDQNYEFVLFGNRNNASYNNRSTKTTISDVTAFTNASTSGTVFSGATDPAVTIVNGDNTINGYVARFTNIIPGADGDILITVSSPSGGFYANALMLRATQSSDTTTPEVSATSPVNNATGVPVNSVVKATFNEAMDAGSITPSTFLVSDGIANIGGTVSYSGATATFTPSGPLAHSTKYTATITTGVMDVAGNPMTANYQWSFTTGTSGTDVFTAYNDLAWSAGQVNNKITVYTTGRGGLLKDYLTGANTPVTLTIAGGYVVSGTLAQGSNANTGTDAYNIFNGIVNSVGLISYSATNLTFTFTGLDPDQNYEFVLFGNRNNAAYNNRSTTIAISDVRFFTNTSTPGTVFSGATDPAVTIVNGDNTANGHVARFTNIIPGADGDMLITVSSPSGGFYANALMLRATQLSETTATTVSATDVAGNSNNGILVDDSVRTTGKIDDTHKTPETGITLKSFRAKAGRDGRITLHWETPSETDTAGFNLYRSQHKSGKYTKVNNVLIHSRDINQSGERYTFTDEPDSGRSHYYKLEDVNAYGDNTLYSPIKARMKSPRKNVP